MTDNVFLAPYWLSIIPYGYFLFEIHLYRLIPGFERDNRKVIPYSFRLLAVLILLFTPFFAISLMSRGAGTSLRFIILLFILMSFIATALAWLIYERNKEHIHQLISLKEELGKAHYNLQFLRSQINPHFLFNVLNTLYGMALQEKAERTGEGIQKLGEMMRFMLQENMQDRILINREITYIRHYIDLQLLRIQGSTDIVVESRIDDPPCRQYITPMLLVPFIENAFKHGISLKEKSWIKILLRYDIDALTLDIYNSIHTKAFNDPEKARSGLGLENVKQRLNLLYPGKHELIIRNTGMEFFVHLTIKF